MGTANWSGTRGVRGVGVERGVWVPERSSTVVSYIHFHMM